MKCSKCNHEWNARLITQEDIQEIINSTIKALENKK
jgi:hypothetical protein